MTKDTYGCVCGHVSDVAAMVKRGWQSDAAGGAMLLANCTACGSTRTIEERADASICGVCHRLVTGCDGDSKIAIVDPTEGAMVLCFSCFRRDDRRQAWTTWDERATPYVGTVRRFPMAAAGAP
jgi:hypothetical protein